FNLEEAIALASARVLCGPVSAVIRDNIAQMKYYVAELLWQYRLDPAYDNMTLAGLLDGGVANGTNANDIAWVSTDWENTSVAVLMGEWTEGDILACEANSFRWSKPHDEVYWDIGLQNSMVYADKISISTINTKGRRGTNGVAGITSLWVYYADGSSED